YVSGGHERRNDFYDQRLRRLVLANRNRPTAGVFDRDRSLTHTEGRTNMAETVRFAASAIGSFWWEGGVLLKRGLAPQGVDLILDDKVNDYHNVLSVAS